LQMRLELRGRYKLNLYGYKVPVGKRGEAKKQISSPEILRTKEK
jgi:hypothetical protein